MSTTDNKRSYVAPQLTAVSIRAEKGYATSSIMQHLQLWEFEDGLQYLTYSDQNHVEIYSVQEESNWAEGTNHFWD